jgi:hypothetical protein
MDRYLHADPIPLGFCGAYHDLHRGPLFGGDGGQERSSFIDQLRILLNVSNSQYIITKIHKNHERMQ